MKEILKQTIELLKNRVQHNLEIIKNNEKKVRELLQEPVSVERSEKLDEKFESNKKMLEENNESIKIQLSLLKFIEKYNKQFGDFIETIESDTNDENSVNEITELTRDDIFELTINGAMDFSKEHPFFDDDHFLNELLSYFILTENYEKCTELKNKKRDLTRH